MTSVDTVVVNCFLSALPCINQAGSEYLRDLEEDDDHFMYDFSSQILQPDVLRPLLSSTSEDREGLLSLFEAVEDLLSIRDREIDNFVDVEIFEPILTDATWYERAWRYMSPTTKTKLAEAVERTRWNNRNKM